jgi:hypothetical protein
MKQTFKLTTFCLSMSVLFNSIAQETINPTVLSPQTIPKSQITSNLPLNSPFQITKLTQPTRLAAAMTSKEETSAPPKESESVMLSVSDEVAEPTTPATAEIELTPPQKESDSATTSSGNSIQDQTIEKLKSVVAQYVTAWQKQDFETMHRQFENWEGGEKLNMIKYIQSFDAKFQLQNWTITKIEPADNNEYKVLVLVSHSLPAKIAALVNRNQTVKSTMVQWWRKEGDKFVHLFHIEQERHMKYLNQMDSLNSSPIKH